MRVPSVLTARRTVQWIFAGTVVLIGIRFTVWVTAHMDGRWPDVSRPAGVEAFLPIDAMLALRHWAHTGLVDHVHPAALAIFVGICLMSVVVAKSFCSHICPIGLLSELCGRLGTRLTGSTAKVWRPLDLVLRSLKFLLLAFFIWAAFLALDPRGVAAFLESPYARVADAKMWLFFAEPSRLTVAVVGALLVGSVFVRDLWCRYLCPYGALLGVLGRFAPLKVTRDVDACIDCEACTRACPARLPVHSLGRVSSIECTSCQDCVVACPVDSCLRIRPPLVRRSHPWLRPARVALLAAAVYLAVVGAFRLGGHWHTSVTEAEYHHRLQEIGSGVYTHFGGRAGAGPSTVQR